MRLARVSRRGTVVVLVALCLVVLLGFTAIAIDGGLLMHDRRALQATADAAALAAAENLYSNYQTGNGLDPGRSAVLAATAVISANGFGQADATINIPPESGIFAGKPGYAEVIINYQQSRGFSGIFGKDRLPVSARAVAIGKWTAAKNGILVLNPTAPGALTNNGSGSFGVVGAPTIVDSNAPNDATATGGGTCYSPEFDLTGTPGISGSGNWVGTIYSGQPPTPDPLRYIPEPDPSTMVVQSKNGFHVSGNISKTYTIYPGVYNGGITVSGQATLNMEPGIYYMNGGGFGFTGQGNLNASGVLIVNNPPTASISDSITINGNGQINFSPPTSGIYAGISIWQTRSATNTVNITGNGGSSMSGTFYAQHGTLSVSGNGLTDVIGSQYISYNVVLGGNGGFAVNWNPNLAGRTRYIYLVE